MVGSISQQPPIHCQRNVTNFITNISLAKAFGTGKAAANNGPGYNKTYAINVKNIIINIPSLDK
jgi:hypothetical protein